MQMRFLLCGQLAKNLLAVIALLPAIFTANAQHKPAFFYDTVSKVSHDGYIESGFMDDGYLYQSGASFSDHYPLPTVTKMDTMGNVVWTATDNDHYSSFGAMETFEYSYQAACRSTVKSGGRVYTIAGREGTASFLSYTHYEIWSLSDTSGTLLWKTSLGTHFTIEHLADYSPTELLAIATGDVYNDSSYCYVISKATGAVIRRVAYGSSNYYTDIMVDNSHNILLSDGYTCKKYRNSRFDQLLWTSEDDDYGTFSIKRITQAGSLYIYMGTDNVRSVDTLTGKTVWYRHVDVGHIVGEQGGGDARPQDFIVRDSSIYVTWRSIYVGGVLLTRGFTLTRINLNTGAMVFNVAYDFNGVPADPTNRFPGDDGLDWPVAMCMDDNKQIFMTGSYDYDYTGNWGIMKIDGVTGAERYEATITDDSTQRFQSSTGEFITYQNGKVYCSGNMQKKNGPFYYLAAKPVLVAFDTGAVYREQYRISPYYTMRYPSSLVSLQPAGANNMALLKKVGRSGIVEMRNSSNRLLWSQTFSSAKKFVVPQSMAVLGDTAVAASFITYKEDEIAGVLPDAYDSLLFVSLNMKGEMTFRHSMPYEEGYDLSPLPVYTDTTGHTNFLFRSSKDGKYAFKAYMLGSNASKLSYVSKFIEIEPSDSDAPALKVMPVQHYNGDTMIAYYANLYQTSEGWMQSSRRSDTGYTGYAFYGFRDIYNFKKTYSALTTGPSTVFVMGRDAGGNIKGELYDHKQPNHVVWTYNPNIQGTMYNADTSATSLYTLSKNGSNAMVITKLNRATGKVGWTFQKTPGTSYSSFWPVDFKYDPVHHYFRVAGYISDTSVSYAATTCFSLVLDSSGNVITDETFTGFGQYENRISSVNTFANGTHMYGGTLTTDAWGAAGFYSLECYGNTLTPSVSIASSDSAVCKNVPVTFRASPVLEGDSPVYQWLVNGNMAGGNTDTFTTGSLLDGDKVKVRLTSNADCLQTSVAESNEVAVTVYSPASPSVSIAGIATTEEGQTTALSAKVINSGSQPELHWQDSTHTHNWQTITGATDTFFVYRPMLTGDAIKCTVKSNDKCSTAIPAISNAIYFTILTNAPAGTSGVISYPNPAYETFTIDSLAINDRWRTAEVVSVTGNQRLLFANVEGRTKLTLQISGLPKGIYVVTLRRAQGKPVYIKFIKL